MHLTFGMMSRLLGNADAAGMRVFRWNAIDVLEPCPPRRACDACSLFAAGCEGRAKRIECRFPDPSSNPYLAFSALLLAGLDGIKNKIEPPAPVDKNIYELPPEEAAEIAQVPTSLPAVLAALEADHDFLTVGDVFTPDLIETWIDYKYENEIQPVALRPTPHEFELYYDI